VSGTCPLKIAAVTITGLWNRVRNRTVNLRLLRSPIVLRLTKATTVLLLLALLSLNGAGLLFAYTEVNLAQGRECKRTCCHLSKSGNGYASACCAVRCGEDVSETGSEPARERLTFGQTELLGTATPFALLPPAPHSPSKASRSKRGDRPLVDGQPDLNIQHSVLLV